MDGRTHVGRARARTTPIAAFCMTVGILCAACASSGTLDLGSPEALPAYEARLARDSSDIDALIGVGAGYRATGRAAEALPLLQRAHRADPEHGMAAVVLGLTYEDLGDYAAALDVYEDYLADAPSSDLRTHIRGRVAVVTRAKLAEEVRAAIAREGTVAPGPPAPYTVAIYPYVTAAADEALRPLGRAVAELLATDLAGNERITVVERAALHLLQEELQLQQTGLIDPATAARTGRLLRAGVVVQGEIVGDESRLVLETLVVDAIRGGADADRLRQEDAIGALFELEARLAIGIMESIGIELTPAERERIAARPTENLQALLAYGLGLEASDRGQFQEAAAHFSEAARLDGGFADARAQADRAAAAAVAATTSTDEVSVQAGQAPAAADALAAVEALVPSVAGRDVAAEALGSEGLGRRTILQIIIRGH
jgi:tetratricopeptide (TPR) repeat protein